MKLVKLSKDSCVFPAMVFFANRRGYGARVWVAEWSPAEGVLKRARFSVRKYGEEVARQKALEKRWQMAKLLLKED